MLDKWSTQCAVSVTVCAVLAMHVPNPDIPTSWRFFCASIHPSLFFTAQKGKSLPRRSANIGFFKTLRLRFALCTCSPFPLFFLNEAR